MQAHGWVGPGRRTILHPHSDEVLIQQARKGSQQAFSQLVQRHQGSVYSLCYRMVGNPAEAEDLAQEAFLRLYRSLDSFKAGGRLRPWLHRITANVCMDQLRRRREATLPLDELMASENGPSTHRRDELPEDAYLSRETRLDVQQALLRLPGEYRVALVLRYLEDLSYQEIAEALGVTLSTVETRIFRAKKMLGRILASPHEGGKEGPSHELHVERGAGLPLR